MDITEWKAIDSSLPSSGGGGMGSHTVDYRSTEYKVAAGLELDDFKLVEDWDGRPASAWAVQKIGLFQSKVEKYGYRLYHSNSFHPQSLLQLMPAYVLIQYANETFGYDGWKYEIVDVQVTECLQVAPNYTVKSEATIKVSLKDGTNTTQTSRQSATLPSKGETYGKARKQAITFAIKQALLSFEKIILDHTVKVENNYYVDGLYASGR